MSFLMALIRIVLVFIPTTFTDGPRAVFRAVGRPRRAASMTRSVRRLAHVHEDLVNGQRVIRLTPKSHPSGHQVMYLHGGGFIAALSIAHWWVIASILRNSRATVTVPLYGLAPENTVDDAYHLLDAVYSSIIRLADKKRVFLMGDSAGGSLALGWAQHCRDEGLRCPDAVVLVSPWVDITMSNPGIPPVVKKDPMLGVSGLIAAGQLWAGSYDLSDARVSVLSGRMYDLPPVYIYQGTHDLLYPDSMSLAQKITDARGSVELRIYPGAIHDFVCATMTAEARSAMRRINTLFAGNSEPV